MNDLKIMNRDVVGAIARIVLSGVNQEYPNQPGHVLLGPLDARLPRELHPAFFGCYDWHSAVHSHWTMLKLLECGVGEQHHADMLEVLADHFSAVALEAELAYFQEAGRAAFERPYGWAWVWKLTADLARSPIPEAKGWHANIRPLALLLAGRFAAWLGRQVHPCRAGTHGNTAFAMAFGVDFAKHCDVNGFAEAIGGAASRLYGSDSTFTLRMEPSGNDFISPTLAEICLMGQLLPAEVWRTWFAELLQYQEEILHLRPVSVTDWADPQGVHLDGLNLSRAYHLAKLAKLIPDEDFRRQIIASADGHWRAGIQHMFTGDFLGEHWLGTFAVLAALEMTSNSMDCFEVPER